MEKISVILPVFNERQNILSLIDAIERELRGLEHEIVVVDDDSTDGTAAVLLGRKDPVVCVIRRSGDRGYAASIRCGIQQAQGDTLVIMDSDFNHDPGDIKRMLDFLPGHDCVSASRFLKGGRMAPTWRGICSRIFNIFIRQATGSRLTDNLFGFFAIRRPVLAACPFDDIFFGFGDYGMRLLFYLQKNGATILECPAVCGPRRAGDGNRHYWRTFRSYFQATLALAGRGRIS